jgi:predicted permease
LFDLLSITAPIFLLIALGFVATRTGIVKRDFIQGLGFFVLNFALPALILRALLGQDLRETFNVAYVAAYAGGSLAVFLGAFIVFRYWLRRSLPHAAIASLGGVASNSGFVGFPIAALAVGMPALTALPLAMLVENALVIPLALVLAEAGQTIGKSPSSVARKTLLRLARTPLFLAILVGLVLSALGIRPPVPISTTIAMVADASTACALFVVGGTLAGMTAMSAPGDLAWIVLAKLVLHPLAVAAGFVLLGGVPPGLMAAGIVLASAPMLTVYPILGQRFGLGPLCAAALVAATAASFITITAAIGLVETGEAAAQLTVVPAERQTGFQQDGQWLSPVKSPAEDAAQETPSATEPNGTEDPNG